MKKRALDLTIIFLSSPITFPIMGLTYLLLLISTKKNPLFIQKRIGKDHREFNLIKFKTMRDGAGSDKERTTKIGSLLRKLSIDELPEIFNILKGEMSIVGPRPLPSTYLPFFTSEEKRRHSVLPGLTGLAQVSGRNKCSWSEKFSFDLLYIKEASLYHDIKIIMKTFFTLFKFGNINANKSQTMKPLNERLVIIGSGGHAKVVYETAIASGYEIFAVADEDTSKLGQHFFDHSITSLDTIPLEALTLVAIGNSKIRERISLKFKHSPTLIHPKAMVSSSARLGRGTVVFAGAVIQASCDIGEYCIINTSAHIDHDCDIKDFSHIAPGAGLCGGCSIEAHTLIGNGAKINPLIHISHNSVVGAGSCVVTSIKTPNETWVGVPAKRVVSKLSEQYKRKSA